jgi:hypothetical protein
MKFGLGIWLGCVRQIPPPLQAVELAICCIADEVESNGVAARGFFVTAFAVSSPVVEVSTSMGVVSLVGNLAGKRAKSSMREL